MKKQLFFLFYSEDEKNDINAKLVKAYVNRFIVDEDAECEVIEVNTIPDVEYSDKLLNLSESVKIQCERQSLYSGSKRHFSTPSIFTPMLLFHLANLIMAPSLYGLLIIFLTILMIGLPTIDSTVPYKILDYFVMATFLPKMLLFAKKYFQVLVLFCLFVLCFQSFPVSFIRNIFEPEIFSRSLSCIFIIKLVGILSDRYFPN